MTNFFMYRITLRCGVEPGTFGANLPFLDRFVGYCYPVLQVRNRARIVQDVADPLQQYEPGKPRGTAPASHSRAASMLDTGG